MEWPRSLEALNTLIADKQAELAMLMEFKNAAERLTSTAVRPPDGVSSAPQPVPGRRGRKPGSKNGAKKAAKKVVAKPLSPEVEKMRKEAVARVLANSPLK